MKYIEVEPALKVCWGESQGSDWSILIEPSLLTILIEPPLLVNFP